MDSSLSPATTVQILFQGDAVRSFRVDEVVVDAPRPSQRGDRPQIPLNLLVVGFFEIGGETGEQIPRFGVDEVGALHWRQLVLEGMKNMEEDDFEPAMNEEVQGF